MPASLISFVVGGVRATPEHTVLEPESPFVLCRGYPVLGVDTSKAPDSVFVPVRSPRWKSISRRHAKFDYQGGVWRVTDLASVNGVYLNLTRITPRKQYPLVSGDRIDFGDPSAQNAAASYIFVDHPGTCEAASDTTFATKELVESLAKRLSDQIESHCQDQIESLYSRVMTSVLAYAATLFRGTNPQPSPRSSSSMLQVVPATPHYCARFEAAEGAKVEELVETPCLQTTSLVDHETPVAAPSSPAEQPSGLQATTVKRPSPPQSDSAGTPLKRPRISTHGSSRRKLSFSESPGVGLDPVRSTPTPSAIRATGQLALEKSASVPLASLETEIDELEMHPERTPQDPGNPSASLKSAASGGRITVMERMTHPHIDVPEGTATSETGASQPTKRRKMIIAQCSLSPGTRSCQEPVSVSDLAPTGVSREATTIPSRDGARVDSVAVSGPKSDSEPSAATGTPSDTTGDHASAHTPSTALNADDLSTASQSGMTQTTCAEVDKKSLPVLGSDGKAVARPVAAKAKAVIEEQANVPEKSTTGSNEARANAKAVASQGGATAAKDHEATGTPNPADDPGTTGGVTGCNQHLTASDETVSSPPLRRGPSIVSA